MNANYSYASAVYGRGQQYMLCLRFVEAIQALRRINSNLNPKYITEHIRFPQGFPTCQDWEADPRLLTPMMFAYIQWWMYENLGIRVPTDELDSEIKTYIRKRTSVFVLSTMWVSMGARNDPGFSWAENIFLPLPQGMSEGWTPRWVRMQLGKAREYMEPVGQRHGGVYDDRFLSHNSGTRRTYAAAFVMLQMCAEVQQLLAGKLW